MARLSMVQMQKRDRILDEKGAAVVEFAFALLFLFFFFAAYVQIQFLCLAHERLSLASFVASRVYSVDGGAKAASVVNSIASGVNVRIEPDGGYQSETIKSRTIALQKELSVPIDFRNIDFSGNYPSPRGGKFTIRSTVRTFRERDPGGDN